MKNPSMRDQSRRQRLLDDKQEISEIFKKLLTGFAIFCAITSAYAIGGSKEARSETAAVKNYYLPDMPMKKVDRRLLISREARSYSNKVIHKPISDIGDTE